MTVPNKVASLVLAEVAKGVDGPFFKDGDDTCLRYDAIEFRLTGDKMRDALVTFFWKGEDVYTITAESVDLKFGDTVSLVGCRGQMAVKIV